MPLELNPIKVTLDANPNLRTTIDTKNRIGVSSLDEPNNYQARAIGIKGSEGSEGAQGNQGIQGDQGDIGLVYRGEWNSVTEYSFSDSVSYQGSLFYYISNTPSTNKLPTDTNYWDLIVAQGETGPPGSSSELYAQYTKDPVGFVDRTTSKMSFDDSTRTFTIEPALNGGEYIYFIEGIQFTVTIPYSIAIPDSTGTWFIYFDLNGDMQMSTDFPTFGIIATIALIYWDSVLQVHSFFGEERHGISMDWQTHYYLHETVGCQWAKGLDITYVSGGDGTTNDELKISLTNGVIYDEDLRHHIQNGILDEYFYQVLTPAARLPVWYRLGTIGVMKREIATDYPLKFGTTRPEYNNYNGGLTEWELLEVPNNSYCAMWIFATNEVEEPVISIMGQYTDVTLDKAMEVNSVDSLNLGDEFPTPEFKMLYRIIYLVKEAYGNTYKATVQAVTDYRTLVDKTSSGFVGLPPTLTGDKNFKFTQVTPATTWYIAHGLEKNPSISVTDTSGNEVECDILHVDINTSELNFSIPFDGYAYCN